MKEFFSVLQMSWENLEAWSVVEPHEGEELVLSEEVAVGESQGTGTIDTRVPGRLLGRQEAFKRLGAEPYVVDTVQHGYKLVWERGPPPPSFTANNRSAREDLPWVRTEMGRLELLRCVKRVMEQPANVLPLSKVFSNKDRLVLDASRGLNPWCLSRGVKLDDLRCILNSIKEGDFLVTNDLDSGYWHVPVHPDHQKYLGMCVPDEEGNPVFYVWTVLVLGVKDAAHLFTRLIKPIMGALREEGYRGQIYIDDLLTAGASKEEALKNEERAYALFQECGYIFKPSKRSGEPAQEVRFLGLLVNTVEMCFKIPEDKMEKIKGMLDGVAARQRIKVKILARLLGTLQSVRLATGPLVQVFLGRRYLFLVLLYWLLIWKDVICCTGDDKIPLSGGGEGKVLEVVGGVDPFSSI